MSLAGVVNSRCPLSSFALSGFFVLPEERSSLCQSGIKNRLSRGNNARAANWRETKRRRSAPLLKRLISFLHSSVRDRREAVLCKYARDRKRISLAAPLYIFSLFFNHEAAVSTSVPLKKRIGSLLQSPARSLSNSRLEPCGYCRWISTYVETSLDSYICVWMEPRERSPDEAGAIKRRVQGQNAPGGRLLFAGRNHRIA